MRMFNPLTLAAAAAIAVKVVEKRMLNNNRGIQRRQLDSIDEFKRKKGEWS
jgi:hypothetical protein